MHDAHIHLAMEPLKSNLPKIIHNFLSAGGKYILTQTTESTDFTDTTEIVNQYKKTIHLALGLHPTIYEENSIQRGAFKNLSKIAERELKSFEKILLANLDSPNLKAIGETGLDYYQMSLNKEIKEVQREELVEIQKDSFRRHLQLALENNLPLSVHARDVNGKNDCAKDTLKLIAQEGRGLLRGCFHSYTGDIDFVDDILDLGFYIGFNAIITYKSGQDIREVLKKTPVDRILFETDGPFLPPQSVRKNKKIKEKFAQPADVKEIIETAAEIKGIPTQTLEEQTDKNYEELFLNR